LPETTNADAKEQVPLSKGKQEASSGNAENPTSSLTLPTRQQRTSATLPQIVAQGLKKQKIAAYEALKQAGFIYNAVEYLVGESVL
jgi:hypothetical protein